MVPHLIFSSSLILCDPKNFLSANKTLKFISVYFWGIVEFPVL